MHPERGRRLPGFAGPTVKSAREDSAVSVVIRPDRLRQEMTRCGWDAMHLAREARLSPATVSTALAGRPIAAKSLSLIANALLHAPVVGLIDSLLSEDSSSRDLG